MKLEVLHIPDCPNLPPLLERLAAVTDLPVTTRVIDSDNEAAEFGMAGSPTLLINGVDPFATGDDGDCGVSCRLYRDQDGRIVPAPSVEQLRHAITAAGQSARPGSARTLTSRARSSTKPKPKTSPSGCSGNYLLPPDLGRQPSQIDAMRLKL
jgi:hypothetical protein